MKTKFLLPAKFKIWGWVLFITGLGLAIYLYLDSAPNFLNKTVLSIEISFNATAEKIFRASLESNNIFDEIISLMIIIGGLLVSFSRERDEDELTSKIRSESLIWAIVLNYTLLLLSVIFLYGFSFFGIMVYNMFTPLIFFILRFNWLLWRSRKSVKYEE